MKLKNSDIRGTYSLLFNVGNRITDITLRWKLALLTEPLMAINELISTEINKLVEEQGNDEKGQKVLSIDNADYIKLMNLETEVNMQYININELQDFNLSISELIMLKPIIKVGV